MVIWYFLVIDTNPNPETFNRRSSKCKLSDFTLQVTRMLWDVIG